jgi:hypothetical protein
VAAKTEGPSLCLGLVVVAVGVVVAIPMMLKAFLPSWGAIGSEHTISAPGVAHLRLSAGKYVVFQPCADRSSGWDCSDVGVLAVAPSTVTVTSDGGTEVPIDPAHGDSLQRGSGYFTPAVGFRVVSRGVYQISVRASQPQEVVVGPPLVSFGAVAGWIAGTFLGSLIVIGGIVMLIVGSTRRQREISGAAAPPIVTPD